MPSVWETFKMPTFYLKIAEFIIAVICASLIINVGFNNTSVSKIQTIYVTLLGYLMIDVILILSYLLGTPLHKLILLLISASGCLMFLVSCGLMFELYFQSDSKYIGYPKSLLGAAIMALVNSAVHGLDTALIVAGRDGGAPLTMTRA